VSNRTIIFVETKREASHVSSSISNSAELHGDISQGTRESTLSAFRKGTVTCLVATDVAARGLDIPEVTLVIQMQPPRNFESYIHRSGRTGRAGKSGTCITLYTWQQQHLLSQIEHHIGLKMQQIPAPTHEDIMEAACKDVMRQFEGMDKKVVQQFRATAEQAITTYGPVEALCMAFAAATEATKNQSGGDGGGLFDGGRFSRNRGGSGGGGGFGEGRFSSPRGGNGGGFGEDGFSSPRDRSDDGFGFGRRSSPILKFSKKERESSAKVFNFNDRRDKSSSSMRRS